MNGESLQKVGQGRSAEVFLRHDPDGRAIVRKIFVGEGISKLVLFLLTGSANPYTWCEDAIRTAVLRRRQRRPWVALAVGGLPIVGNAAYPAQLLYCSTGETGELARFILYDSLAAIGRALPVWGGADSLTEHFCNRLGDMAVRWLQKPIA